MKIDLQSINREQFMVHEHIINGEMCYLVQPQHIGCSWTQENKIFRSSVWNFDGELISAGFPKFVNFGEKPDVFPVPTSLDNATIVEKMDGSLLVVSKYKGQFILRTRGTVDAYVIDNGYELELFNRDILHKLSDIHLLSGDTWSYSVLFEWVSPTNKIVLDYGDTPDWYLVGIVYHNDYSLIDQMTLDNIAWEHGLKRPETYTFTTIEDLLSNVERWKGKEGVCIYSKNGQEIHKCKSADYLIKHRFKSDATLENTLELFFAYEKPEYQEFERKLIEQFDYECFGMVRGYASSVCDASKGVARILNGIQAFVEPLKSVPRKDAAQSIISSYGDTGRSAMAFTLLDGKPLSTDQHKKLYWQVLKK